jgi:hypothetical protein
MMLCRKDYSDAKLLSNIRCLLVLTLTFNLYRGVNRWNPALRTLLGIAGSASYRRNLKEAGEDDCTQVPKWSFWRQ